MHWEQQVQYASLTDVGFRRRNNEDQYAVHLSPDRETWSRYGHLFVVADGMGGHAVGELASKIAIDTIPHIFFKHRARDAAEGLKAAIEAANAAIHGRGSQNFDFNRMGTTCAALVLTPNGAITGHVGDSRVYRIRGGRIDLLTQDHSLQWELERRGRLQPEHVILNEARHIITRSLGPEESVEVDLTGPHTIWPGDVFVLCSDGLTAHVSDEEIGILARELPPKEACRLLVHLANLRGGSDNITVIVARVGEMPSGVSIEQPAAAAPTREAASWKLLAVYWGLAGLFVTGAVLILMGRVLSGIPLAGAALIGALVTLLRSAASPAEPSESTDPKLIPARSTRIRLSRSFLRQLGILESELRKTAMEEEWTIDWQTHEAAHSAARAALQRRDYSATLRELAKSIDALMAGVHAYRKQIVREARWGKSGGLGG